jgi:MoaA/NifB/PqqE/SkfB family radical SAM enzyme
MYDLIVSPFLGHHFVLRPGRAQGLRIPTDRYDDLRRAAASGEDCPAWLADAAADAFGVELAGRSFAEALMVREPSALGFARASYELNLGCNYDCEHCYLGLKQFKGLAWPDRERLLRAFRDAGVVYLQLTGGEPLIDKHFPDVYRLAYELGMMLHVSTNGSRLHHPAILDLLTAYRPYRVTVSVYGATEASYDGLTRRSGSFRKFQRGLAAAVEAGIPLRLNLVLTNTNAHEEAGMVALADRFGLLHMTYSNISPTIYGGGEVLPAQSVEHLRARKPFTGCNAGHTFFHTDPHGRASICKVGRDPYVSLLDEGVEGLARLGAIADSLLLRTGGCSGCQLSGTCGTCRPLAKLYQEARAPLESYCQHRRS